MPGAAGPGNGATHKRRRRKHFLVTVRLKPLDHNRLHVRATHPEPKGFGVLADVPAANASLDQTVTRKKLGMLNLWLNSGL